MPRRLIRLGARHQGMLLFTMAVLSAGSLVGALYLRAVSLDNRDEAICAKVDRVVIAIEALATSSGTPPQPGDYGYAYWAEHPEERDNRPDPEDAVKAFLEAAACDPNNIRKRGPS